MGDNTVSLLRQLHRNAVALISLVVAISSLSYNTWRNEITEANRSQRIAAFELLLKLNELQQVVFHHHYDKDVEHRGNPRIGWSYVLTIHDLASVLNDPLPTQAGLLRQSWNDNWQQLASSEDSVDVVLVHIDAVRLSTLQLLQSLE